MLELSWNSDCDFSLFANERETMQPITQEKEQILQEHIVYFAEMYSLVQKALSEARKWGKKHSQEQAKEAQKVNCIPFF